MNDYKYWIVPGSSAAGGLKMAMGGRGVDLTIGFIDWELQYGKLCDGGYNDIAAGLIGQGLYNQVWIDIINDGVDSLDPVLVSGNKVVIMYSESNINEYLNYIYFISHYSGSVEFYCTLKKLVNGRNNYSPIERVGIDSIEKAKMLWSRLVEENGMLRIIQNGNIVSVEPDYYDSEILSRVSSSNPTKLARIVGDILGHETVTSQSFLEWRCRELIDNGTLIVDGEYITDPTDFLRNGVRYHL